MMGDLKDVLKTPLSEGARRTVKTIQWIGILFGFSFICLSLLQGMPEDIAVTKIITFLLFLTIIYLAILIFIFPLIVKVVVWIILGSKEKE
jgi:predicted MFS family arabinose efflux permease